MQTSQLLAQDYIQTVDSTLENKLSSFRNANSLVLH